MNTVAWRYPNCFSPEAVAAAKRETRGKTAGFGAKFKDFVFSLSSFVFLCWIVAVILRGFVLTDYNLKKAIWSIIFDFATDGTRVYYVSRTAVETVHVWASKVEKWDTKKIESAVSDFRKEYFERKHLKVPSFLKIDIYERWNRDKWWRWKVIIKPFELSFLSLLCFKFFSKLNLLKRYIHFLLLVVLFTFVRTMYTI